MDEQEQQAEQGAKGELAERGAGECASGHVNDLAIETRQRALTYAFLSRVLSDDELGADFFAALRDNPPQTGTELDAFAAGLQGTGDAGLESARTAVAADHAKCLLGMSALPVSPYESVWTSPEHLMMQDARKAVVAAYAEAGFAKDTAFHLPEDHISIELDFVARLLTRAADKLEAGTAVGAVQSEKAPGQAELDQAARFIGKHLAAWTPLFCEDLERKASTAFYRGVAQMLRAFVAEENATE